MVNLMYHCVYTQTVEESGFQFITSYPYKISSKEFESQVKSIVREFDGEPIDDRVLFTFDDGGVSFIDVIAPILEKYGLTGVFFISTKYIGQPKFMTKEQIVELSKRGHIIASHSHNHPLNMSKMAYADILSEWKISKTILEGIINAPIRIASIPNGNGSENVYKAALEAGYEMLYTSIPTTKEYSYGNLRIIGRYVIKNNMKQTTLLRIVGSRTKRNLCYIQWRLLKLIKAVLGNRYKTLKGIIKR